MEDIQLINFKEEPFTSIINSEEFYFKKGKNALNKWLDYSIDDNDKITFRNILKDYNTFKSIKSGDKFFELKELFFEIISYCDLHASDKEKYNKYEDKRVLAKAGVRMSPWVNHLYNYKYHPDKTNITVKNALDVLKDPINNINSVSVTHRQLISKFYLNTAYDPLSFVESLKVKFSQLPLIPKVTENTTVLIASVLYNQKTKWMKENNSFEGFTNTFEKYLKDQSLPFQIVKRDKDWFWIADLEGNFGTEDIHYELILEKGKISIDLHFEQSKKTAKEYQSLIGSLPEFLEWKNWGSWGKCISHKNKVSLGEVDSVENAISYLNELYDYTVEFYKKEKQVMKKRIELLKYKKQIILQGPPGTGKTREAKLIAKEMLGLQDVKELIENEQFKLIQFHPSYTYEDFVRGIVSKTNEDGDVLLYEAENKTLAEFAQKALLSYKNIRKSIGESFIDFLQQKNSNSSQKVYFDSERMVRFLDITFSGGRPMLRYELYNENANEWYMQTWLNMDETFNEENFLTNFHKYYFNREEIKIICDYFMDFVKYIYPNFSSNKFVLVIDEINRANLSSVLGELIYALEYRGEAVESMYAIDGDNKLILPPNLYIIGTMNTADRSVGHIDYAIRRRFAFVDVLPKDLSSEENILFDSELFYQVEKLFDTYLSPEFDKKEVQLGHSYFIDKSEEGGTMDIRLEYEIKPILLEYVRDGVLIGQDIKKKIEALTVSI